MWRIVWRLPLGNWNPLSCEGESESSQKSIKLAYRSRREWVRVNGKSWLEFISLRVHGSRWERLRVARVNYSLPRWERIGVSENVWEWGELTRVYLAESTWESTRASERVASLRSRRLQAVWCVFGKVFERRRCGRAKAESRSNEKTREKGGRRKRPPQAACYGG